MLTSPVIIFFSFFIFLVFVIGVAPTDFWMRIGSFITRTVVHRRHDRAAAQFARATAAASFNADVDFVPIGIAFAFDRSKSVLFLGDDSNTPGEDLVPVSTIRAHKMGVVTGGLTDENYVDIFPVASPVSRWRVSCGEDIASAHAIENLLSDLGLPKA
jgi:hypothetical protein